MENSREKLQTQHRTGNNDVKITRKDKKTGEFKVKLSLLPISYFSRRQDYFPYDMLNYQLEEVGAKLLHCRYFSGKLMILAF